MSANVFKTRNGAALCLIILIAAQTSSVAFSIEAAVVADEAQGDIHLSQYSGIVQVACRQSRDTSACAKALNDSILSILLSTQELENQLNRIKVARSAESK